MNQYRVSNVIGHKHLLVTSDGFILNTRTNKTVKIHNANNGYSTFGIMENWKRIYATLTM